MDDKKLTSSEKIIPKKRTELGNQKEVLKTNNSKNEELGIFKRIGMIFSHPKDFFNIVKEEEGIKKPFSIYLYLLLVYVVFGLIMMSMMMFSSGPRYGSSNLSFAGFGFGFMIIAPFLYAGIIQISLFVLGERKRYQETFKVLTYSIIPSMLIGIIPFIGMFFWIYSFVLAIIGLSIVHNISKTKATIACLLPILILIGIIFSFFFYTFRY